MITQNKLFKRLSEVVCVDIQEIEISNDPPHEIMSSCHRSGLKAAKLNKSWAVFLPPDCIWSACSMENLIQRLATSDKNVHICGLRLSYESLSNDPQFKERQASTERYSNIVIEPRDLVTLSEQHLHSITKDLFYEPGPSEHLMPANLVWTVGDQGYLLRCFHLHPLAINTERLADQTFQTTIDDDLGLRDDPQAKKDYVVTNSDEILCFEISRDSHRVHCPLPKSKISSIVTWASSWTNQRHRNFVLQTIVLKSNRYEATDPLWDEHRRKSDRIIILALLWMKLDIFKITNKILSLKSLYLQMKTKEKIKNTFEIQIRLSLKSRILGLYFLKVSKLFENKNSKIVLSSSYSEGTGLFGKSPRVFHILDKSLMKYNGRSAVTFIGSINDLEDNMASILKLGVLFKRLDVLVNAHSIRWNPRDSKKPIDLRIIGDQSTATNNSPLLKKVYLVRAILNPNSIKPIEIHRPANMPPNIKIWAV
ncbi:hypothetical protein OAQ35_04060 [Litorivicinus sp.]|nr:hypothetical protein [Litorivicinus sp.]